MDWLRQLRFRLLALFRRRRLEEEMMEEMRIHLAMDAEANRCAGMEPSEARHEAQRRFGGLEQAKESCRDERTWMWIEQLAQDCRFAARGLARARRFSAAVILTLAIGIGVAAAVFSLRAWVLFYDAPYPNARELHVLGYRDNTTPFVPARTGLHFAAIQEQTNVFSEFAAVRREMANVVIGGEPTAVEVLSVSRDTFRTLGVRPIFGRGFADEEFHSGHEEAVIISDLFWRQHFQADPDVVGRNAIINQRPCTVIGVLDRNQRMPVAFKGAIYRPLVFEPNPKEVFDPVLGVIGRLRPDVTPAAAAAAIEQVKLPPGVPQWAEAFFAEQKPVVMPLKEAGNLAGTWVLFAAAMLLFSLACLNAMNLMLVRLLARSRELTIRLAMGCTRWRLARLLLIEVVGLAIAAVVVVAAAAKWCFPHLSALIENDESARYLTYWDWRNLGFIGLMGIVAGAVVAILPVWRISGGNLNDRLKSKGIAVGESRATVRGRNALVAIQAALAVLLLAGTGLMMRTFQKLHEVDLGFDPEGKVKVYASFPRGNEPKPTERIAYFERLKTAVAALPGVKAVSATQDSILVGGFYGTAQLKMKDGTFRPVVGSFVPSDFHHTAGLTLKRGRWLTEKRSAPEAVINETMARARFGDEDPIGQSFTIQASGNMPYLVVGVVRDIRDTVRSPAGMQYFVPAWAYPPNVTTLLVQMQREPGKEISGLLRHAIYKFDPMLIVAHVTTIREAVGRSMSTERYTYLLLRGLAGIAFGLTFVGLFAVVAYAANARTREFGVRVALGARPADLHWLVLQRGMVTAGVGIVIGTLAALALTRYMKSLLFETSPYDLAVYLGVAGVLLIAAAVACWVPARRAAKTDPIVALRCE